MKPWIFSIAKAESKRYYAASRPGRSGGRDAAPVGVPAWPEYLFDFTKFIEDREYVKTLINGLENEEQQLYILHYFYGLPLKEISEMLNVNYSTVRSMHMRGMTKMRKQSSRRARCVDLMPVFVPIKYALFQGHIFLQERGIPSDDRQLNGQLKNLRQSYNIE